MSQHCPTPPPAVGVTVRRRADQPSGYCPLWEVRQAPGNRLYLERSPSHLGQYQHEELFLWADAADFVELSQADLVQWLG